MFIIEDELHAEEYGEFPDFQAAMQELKRRSNIPWDHEPNLPPCTSWRTCGRVYVIVEYDDAQTPPKMLKRQIVLEIKAAGPKWFDEAAKE